MIDSDYYRFTLFNKTMDIDNNIQQLLTSQKERHPYFLEVHTTIPERFLQHNLTSLYSSL